MFEFDLADRVDDLICIFEGGNPDTEMDTISMLITGWIIFFFCAVALIKYVYRNFIKRNSKKLEDASISTTTISQEATKETSKDSSKVSDNKNKTTSVLSDGKSKSKEPNEKIQSTGATTSATVKGAQTETTNTSSTNNSNGNNSNSNRSESTAVRRRRMEREQFSQSFDLSDKNTGPCNGPDSVVVDFINRCHEWLYSPQTLEQKEWSDVRENFIDSINKTLREDEKKNPVVASVVDLVFKDDMALSNCFAECEHENTVKVTCDCETKMTGVLSLYSPEKGTSRFDFFVDRLCGRLNILLDNDEEAAIVKFDGWPEICVGIASNAKTNQLDSKLSESLAEKLTTAIRNAVFEVELRRLKDFPKAPRMTPRRKGSETFKSYLVMKVVRGIDIGIHKGCEEPYCAVELDDPPQKFQTDCQSGQNPYWGENFVFNILPTGGEILFEIYDRVGTRFMGCNILSIDEIGAEKNRVIPLKSRRMEICDQITGSLEVQFTFLDEKEFIQKSREIIEKVSPNGNLIKTTKTTFTKPPSAQSDAFTEKVIKEFERNAIPNPNKSTLIIHAVQRESPSLPSRDVVKVEKKSDGRYIEVSDDEDKFGPLISEDGKKDGGRDGEIGLEGQYGEERGRRRTRRGDIFTSIRRRFSKTRSRSVNPDGAEEPSTAREQGSERDRDIFARSISVDRESLISGRQFGSFGPHSARSSASELSAVSGHSTSTFIHENSTLVIECIENRIRKYYLVPPHLAETGKWKKRGKKLHIFNDHTFVAKHMQSGTSCELCHIRFPFSLGKQGYQCRDCKMRCHKECHVRATNYCQNTTVYDIELGTAKCVQQTNTFKGVCSTIFSGRKANNSANNAIVNANGKDKDCMGKNLVEKNNSCNLTNNSSLNKNSKTNPRKKSSIFRRVTRLGKISEENLTSSKTSTLENSILAEINSSANQPDQDKEEMMEEKSIEDLVNHSSEDNICSRKVVNVSSSASGNSKVQVQVTDIVNDIKRSERDKSQEEDIIITDEGDDTTISSDSQSTVISSHLIRSPRTEDFAKVE